LRLLRCDRDPAAAFTMKDDAIPNDAVSRFRVAASRFTGTVQSRVSRLEAVRDEIAAMRGKGASFRTISEMLSHCGIRASDTCVMRFCRSVLGEQPVRANNAARPDGAAKPGRAVRRATKPERKPAAQHAAPEIPEEDQIALLDDLLNCPPPDPAKGGPRIAKIQFANPNEL